MSNPTTHASSPAAASKDTWATPTVEMFGRFELNSPLAMPHLQYLQKFCSIRHMRRRTGMLTNLADPLRIAAGLPLGADGEFYVGAHAVDSESDLTIVDANVQPRSQPGVLCDWTFGDDASSIVWAGQPGSLQTHLAWLQYLLDEFLVPWGHETNGAVYWRSTENDSEQGVIVLRKNEISSMLLASEYDADDSISVFMDAS
jgi:hypothetical protein